MIIRSEVVKRVVNWKIPDSGSGRDLQEICNDRVLWGNVLASHNGISISGHCQVSFGVGSAGWLQSLKIGRMLFVIGSPGSLSRVLNSRVCGGRWEWQDTQVWHIEGRVFSSPRPPPPVILSCICLLISCPILCDPADRNPALLYQSQYRGGEDGETHFTIYRDARVDFSIILEREWEKQGLCFCGLSVVWWK